MGPRILVIEDATDQQMIIRASLEKDYDLAVAANLVEARRELLVKVPDLILLDANLPDGDGFSFCTWLTEDSRYQAIPIIILTGRTEAEEKAFAFKSGAQDYITKPFHPVELQARIATRLKSFNKADEVGVQDLKLNLKNHELWVGANASKAQSLSTLETQLLRALIEAPQWTLAFSQAQKILQGSSTIPTKPSVDRIMTGLQSKFKGSLWSLDMDADKYQLKRKNPPLR